MADNLDEEALDNPKNPQSKSFSDEKSSTNESDTGISNQETQNMEVHKHPHHVMHKKKWGEYLLEFIMLFLAVFLGFAAENLRERITEHNIEKEYIHSLVEDLKSDTLQSDIVLTLLNSRTVGVDSVITALSSSGIIENSNNAYRLWSRNIGFPDFISNDRTIQQLKNSGGLRLIRNKAISDAIMKYDQVIRDFNGLSAVMNGVVGDQHIYSQLFDFINLDKNANIPVPLTEQGRKLLNEAYANRKVWRFILSNLVSRLEEVNKESKDIMLFIQKEYPLE
ncbi:MAG TPA: hypothetical protein VGG71_08575 [Chitinophagaceae bacterium]